ncbi:unknown protein (Partial), partial [Seminavis robusta]|eukprot:Sro3680_g350230.1 n/a (414) ;mRNA; r:144-1386
MDHKNTKEFPATDCEGVVSEKGEAFDPAFPTDLDMVAGSEDLRLSKLVAARITTSTPAAAFDMDHNNTEQLPIADREGVVSEEEVDPAFPMDLDWVDGSEDLRLSKLVAARLGETEELHQNQHHMIRPSSTPATKTAECDYDEPTNHAHDHFLLMDNKISANNLSCMADASTNRPLEQAHDQSTSSDQCTGPAIGLPTDENNDASNPSAVVGSSSMKHGMQANSSGRSHSLPGAYALAPSGANNNGSNGVDQLPQSEHQSGVLSLDSGLTTASSNSSFFDRDIPVAKIVSNDRDITIPEAAPEDLEAQMGHRKQRERQFTRMGALSLAFFMMVLGLVLLIILFMLSRGQKTDIAGPVPTVSPSASPSMSPSHWRQGDIALQLFPNYTKAMLDELESAQYRAYQWLLDDIEMHDF